MRTICCVCHKTKIGEEWKKQSIPPNEIISHGYCPNCYQQVIHILETRNPGLLQVRPNA